jgi:hypothetical protein
MEGYPTESGTFSITLQVRDSSLRMASRTLNITVKKGMHVAPIQMPEGRANHSFSYTFQTIGGKAPFNWSWTADSWSSLPSGLGLSSDGIVSGIPTAGGTFFFDLTVRDADGQIVTINYLTIVIRSLQITSYSLPAAHLNELYTFTLATEWGDPPMTWTLQSGFVLPPGISLSSTGVISGTPTTVGSFAFTVNVQDASLQTATSQLFLQILAPVEITTSSLPDGNIATPYQAQLSATGGWNWYTWGLDPGSVLPAGITLDGSGSLWGTPTVAGTFDFTVRATSGDLSATRVLRLFIDSKLAILTTSLELAVATGQYSSMVQALGSTPPYLWSRVGGTAGPEFSIDSSTGRITAAPTQAGTFSISVKVTDSSVPAQSASRDFFVQVLPPPTFTTKTLPDGALQEVYGVTVNVDGGLTPRKLRLVEGNLPDGLSFSDPGWSPYFYITGNPTTAGTYPFTLELADSSSPPLTATQQYAIKVNEALRITTDSLPDGNLGDPYHATLSATGGVLPYTWSAYLPQLLIVNISHGTISGVPQAPGSYNVYVQVSSSGFRRSVSKTIPLNITAHPKIRTSLLPPAKLGASYRVSLNGTAWYQPFTWTVSSGSLPAGMTLNSSTGGISGAPSAEGTYSFTVRFQDSAQVPEFDERSLTLEVKAAPGRNDSIATATPISNGTFHASISPYSDPVDGPAVPDSDYYVLTANPGAAVTVETMADRLVPASPMDSVIEIVDAEGNRFVSCRPGGDTYGSFSQLCLNDDFDSYNTLDSKLYFQVPGSSGTPVTFYVHVLDWSGSARPDYVYDLVVSGAN